MEKRNYILSLKSLLLLAFVLLFITSCEDDKVELGENYGFAYTQNAVAQKINVELKQGKSLETSFNFVLRREAAEEVQVSYKYDASLIESINKSTGKNYKAFPQELMTLSKDIVSISAGKTLSDSIKLNIVDGDVLEDNMEYVIPLKATVAKGNIVIPEKDSYVAFIVKALGNMTEKSTGIQVFSCMEINKANPLNHLNFKLKDSGKYLFDGVILFSANMQYNEKTKKVHLSLNPQNQFLFENIEKYVRPLQEEGMKVVFGVLPHHTAAGISNLTDAACKQFAAELKKFNDKYGLDGVFFDDEYGYKGVGDPSVLNPNWSYEASARLVSETKKVMPDKLVTIYAFDYLTTMKGIDGKKPGEFIDYVFPDYFIYYDYSQYFEGLPKNRVGNYSINLESVSPSFLTANLQKFREEGYKTNMVYGLNPDPINFSNSNQLKALEVIAKTFFDEDLDFNGKIYESEWSHISGDPEEWTGE